MTQDRLSQQKCTHVDTHIKLWCTHKVLNYDHVGTKKALLQDPEHKFNKSCKKGNTFNKNVTKRQKFNTITTPTGTPHTDSINIFQIFTTKTYHNKNPSQQPTSLLFDFPSTKTHHNNQHLSFFQQSLKKKKRAYWELQPSFWLWGSELLVGQRWLESAPMFGIEWWSQCQCLGMNLEVNAGVSGLLLWGFSLGGILLRLKCGFQILFKWG